MKKLLIIISTILIILLCVFLSLKEKTINLDNVDLVSSKDVLIEREFDSKYKVSVKTAISTDLEKKIKKLSQEATYLLVGDDKETSEEYYERHNSFNKLIYSSNDSLDSFVADESCKYMFNKLSELDIQFGSIGDIRVIESKNLIISTVVLPDVILKVENSTNPYKYDEKTSNLIITYYFKKKMDDYKLYYIVSDLKNDLYSNEVSFAIKDNNNTKLYNYRELNSINDNIYEKNKNNIFKLTSYKVNEEVTSSIGVLIDNNLLLTSYKFVEESLMNGDFISIKTINDRNVNYDGFVTLNKEYNYAIIKLKDNYFSTTVIGPRPDMEDGVLIVDNVDNNINTTKDIVISSLNNSTIKTTSDSYSDSILYDNNSRLVSLSINNQFVNTDILLKLKEQLKDSKYKTISFDYLKNKYFIDENKYNDKNVVLPDELLKYKIIKDIDKDINIPLVNYSKDGNNISLKYKNNISDYMSSMSIFNSIKDNFKGYKKIVDTDSKQVYENSKYRVIATTEFDYLIIVVVIK